MAATGKTPILLYGSTTTSNVPAAGNLTNSSDGCEIAINVADKNLFFKDSTNAVNTVPIRQSSASSNGWLSSTDWSTFNGKQPAGTYVTSVTGTAPVVSSGGTTPAISMAAANGSTNGYLTSTDWSTFNGKAPAVTYTTNYIPYGQGTTTPNQSANLVFDGTNLGVGVSVPLQKLHVATAGNNYIVSHNTAATSSALLLGAEGAQNTIYSWSTVSGSTGRPLAIYAGATEHSRFSTNGDYTVQNGNLVIGTSGKGIDFSATAGTGTSELLADYEEGDWTPAIGSGSGSITSYTSSGKYTKIGRLVTASFNITITNAGTGSGALRITPPFTPAVSYEVGAGRENALTGYMLQIRADSSNVLIVLNYSNGGIVATNGNYLGSITYTV